MTMKEHDIRPASLFDQLLACSREDIATFFSDTSRFESVPCPACAADQPSGGFEKLGFLYVTCGACDTLYASPRPPADLYFRFLAESTANAFFSSHFYKETALARREKIYRPRAAFCADLARRLGATASAHLVDVGSGFGIFLQEARQTGAFGQVSGIEPVHSLAEDSRQHGFAILEKPMEAVQPADMAATFMTAFEVVEHLLAPEDFLRAAGRVLSPCGILVFTTLTSSGFDLQVLGEHSKTIYPPQHLNFMSVAGLRQLVQRCGLEVVELETPGELDVDIVRNMLLADPALPVPRFARALAESDEQTRQAFQTFLSKHCLSSHVRCVARKPAAQ